MSTIPDQLGVFPLPSTVLFPDALLPLHVFEPRYRALLRDAMAGSGHIVMGVLKPGCEAAYEGSPEIFGTGCVGKVVDRREMADGTSDIILRGKTAVRIDGFVSETPYRVARVTPVPDDGQLVGTAAAEFRRDLSSLLERASPGCVEALRAEWPGDFDGDGSMELLHTIAMYLPVSVEKRLEWLACRGGQDRWLRMRETLVELAEARQVNQRVLLQYEDTRPPEVGEN
jgi:Lon protease-like protein